MDRALKNIAFIPNNQGFLSKISEVIIDINDDLYNCPNLTAWIEQYKEVFIANLDKKTIEHFSANEQFKKNLTFFDNNYANECIIDELELFNNAYYSEIESFITLSISDCLNILTKAAQENLKNDEYLQNIYSQLYMTIILNSLEKQILLNWQENGLLLNAKNEYSLAKNLYCYINNNEVTPIIHHLFVKLPSNLTIKKLRSVFDCLGVNIIENLPTKVFFTNSYQQPSWKEWINNAAPFLAYIVDKYNFDNMYRAYKSKLNEINFYKAKELSVEYELEGEIIESKNSVINKHFDSKNGIYYYSDKLQFQDIMCAVAVDIVNLLELTEYQTQKVINLILLKSPNKMWRWLCNNYEMGDDKEALYEKIMGLFPKFDEVERLRIGQKGEAFIFDFFKNELKGKNPTGTILKNTDTLFEIEVNNQKTVLEWLKDKKTPFDIILSENGVKTEIEVKSTSSSDCHPITLSRKRFDYWRNNRANYRLYRVLDVDGSINAFEVAYCSIVKISD
jgi:hypothetical protein